jgi:hypothetical protein
MAGYAELSGLAEHEKLGPRAVVLQIAADLLGRLRILQLA